MDKKKLGVLIGILRKEKLTQTKNRKWTQSKFCEGICSKSTLSRLEMGLIVSYEEVYIELSNRLSFAYASSDLIDDTLSKLESRLILSVNKGDDLDILDNLHRMKKLLSLGERFIFYKQEQLLIDNLIAYYSHHEFHLSFSIDASIAMLEVFSSTFSSILRMYLYLYLQNTKSNEIYERYLPYIKLDFDENVAVKICYFHSLFVSKSNTALDVFEELWEICRVSEYGRRLREIQSILKLYEAYYDKKLSEQYKGYLGVIIEEDSLMSRLNEGASSLFNHNRDNFVNIYEEMFRKDVSIPMFAIVQYLNETGNTSKIQMYIDNKRYIGQELYRNYLSYHQLSDTYEKQKFIMEVLYPILKENDQLYINYFAKEIYELTKETKKYKDLHLILKLLEKSI